ncbi:hypothetical protein Lser_V15G02360 [Lactuca serriola]
MDTKIAKKMMLMLLVLYVINSLHASSDWSIHLQAKSSLVYVNKRGGGHGGGGGHAGGGHVGDGNDSSGNGGSSRGGANGAGIPAHAAGGQQGPGRKNDGNLHTASLFRLTSTMLVVREFADVFPEELPGVSPERQVGFRTNLVSNAASIAKTSYRLAPPEMQKFSSQLLEPLGKQFIRPTSSPWGVSILFVKKFIVASVYRHEVHRCQCSKGLSSIST